jgi:hypothetical protein
VGNLRIVDEKRPTLRIVGSDGHARNETALERSDRNLVELLQEVRVVQTGVQVLFAFLLTAPLAHRFPELSSIQRHEYFVALIAAGAASILLTAPTAYHRILFRCGDKEYLVQVANRYTIAGLACVGVSMIGAVTLVTDLLFGGVTLAATVTAATLGCLLVWVVLPLRRRVWLRRHRGR